MLSLVLQVTGTEAVNALTIHHITTSYKYDLKLTKELNLVNVKDYITNSLFVSNSKTVYVVRDSKLKTKFVMPLYSVKLKLTSRVDNRVFLSRIANAIKSQETGGEGSYTRKSYSSSACGAYQYMPVTWNNYMNYQDPCSAPFWVQDSRMIDELKSSYNKYHDWRKAVAAHLSPSRAYNMGTWNQYIPGNPTISQYVQSVFKRAHIAYSWR